MEMSIHQKINRARWFSTSLIEQMSNIGAEVGRAIASRGKDAQQSMAAFQRAVELLDLTIEDKKNQGSALKELCRLKAVLVDYFLGQNIYGSDDGKWNAYFYFFNNAASAKYFK